MDSVSLLHSNSAQFHPWLMSIWPNLGKTPIPARALLSNAGFDIDNVLRHEAIYGMAVTYDLDKIELRVDQVTPGGVAARAGVQQHDRLLPLRRTNFDTTEPIEFGLQRGDDQLHVRLHPQIVAKPGISLSLQEPRVLDALLDAPRASSCVRE